MIMPAVLFWKLDYLFIPPVIIGCVENCRELREFDESIITGLFLFAFTDYNSLTLIGYDRKLFLSRVGFLTTRIWGMFAILWSKSIGSDICLPKWFIYWNLACFNKSCILFFPWISSSLACYGLIYLVSVMYNGLSSAWYNFWAASIVTGLPSSSKPAFDSWSSSSILFCL